MNSLLNILLLMIIFKSIYNDNCEMKTHHFYLLPIEKDYYNKTIQLRGLEKYDYILILKSEPRNVDKYHIVLNVSFPINVNIELSNEIIYDFISIEKFCINDFEVEGRYINILGTLYEYSTQNKILEKIWIKVEKILLYKEIDSNKNKIFYLLTNYSQYDKINKEYILMKKMTNEITQNFQIASVSFTKKDIQFSNNYVCEAEENYKNELSIGDELTIFMKLDEDKLRDNFDYAIYDKNQKKYEIGNVKNLLCITYNNNKYDKKC